jgi:hypothetical protein
MIGLRLWAAGSGIFRAAATPGHYPSITQASPGISRHLQASTGIYRQLSNLGSPMFMLMSYPSSPLSINTAMPHYLLDRPE